MSHWMTFGGEEMIVLLLLASYLFFSRERRWKTAGWICAAILAVSMVLGFTRSIFLLGFPAGPALSAVVLEKMAGGGRAGPGTHRAVPRAAGSARARHVRDSAARRSGFQPAPGPVLRETGVVMIRAHPWLGLGPEQIKYQFDQWVPADARPLPVGFYGHLHNIYLQYAAERGIPVLLALLWLIAKTALGFRTRAVAQASYPASAGSFCMARSRVIIAILAEGFAEYNLGDSEVLTMFLAVVAFGYLAVETQANGDTRNTRNTSAIP